MHEILFRGQTRKNGEKVNMATGEKVPSHWVYGGIFPGSGDFSIIYGGAYEKLTSSQLDKHVVYSDTVGQYIGKTDKNGKKIFEGDILAGAWNARLVVYFDEDYLQFRAREISSYARENAIDYYNNGKLEVVGNIYDNPELSKKEENL